MNCDDADSSVSTLFLFLEYKSIYLTPQSRAAVHITVVKLSGSLSHGDNLGLMLLDVREPGELSGYDIKKVCTYVVA